MPKKKPQQSGPIIEVLVMFGLLTFCILVGTAFYTIVERHAVIDAFYFASMILTTIGDAGLSPKTDVGKVFTVIYAFVGIGIFLGFAAALFGAAMDRLRRR